MAKVVFKTESLLDIRAITVMGMSAKPNTVSPIGYFGTGLKYAIAVLCRHKIPVTIWIGSKSYSFHTRTVDFRGVEFEQLYMKRGEAGKISGRTEKWFNRILGETELPFTTEYGKNWELWMAFRELESNTRDEGGLSYVRPAGEIIHEWREGCTVIEVSSEKFVDVFLNQMDDIFLPKALQRPDEQNKNIQVFKQPSKHLYYRGLRVYTPKDPFMYTYNILGKLELTEDRTVAYPFEITLLIATYVATQADEQIVGAIANLKPEDKKFEAELDFKYSYATPSPQFTAVVEKKKARGHIIPSSMNTFYARYAPAPPKPPETRSVVDQLQWWIQSGELNGHVGLVDLLLKAVEEINGMEGKARNGETGKGEAGAEEAF